MSRFDALSVDVCSVKSDDHGFVDAYERKTQEQGIQSTKVYMDHIVTTGHMAYVAKTPQTVSKRHKTHLTNVWHCGHGALHAVHDRVAHAIFVQALVG